MTTHLITYILLSVYMANHRFPYEPTFKIHAEYSKRGECLDAATKLHNGVRTGQIRAFCFRKLTLSE